jgi:hypothetical protein
VLSCTIGSRAGKCLPRRITREEKKFNKIDTRREVASDKWNELLSGK